MDVARIGKKDKKRQGCILSPILFSIIFDYIMRWMENMKGLRTSVKPRNIGDVEYGDDTCLIAESLSMIVELTVALTMASRKFGLKQTLIKQK